MVTMVTMVTRLLLLEDRRADFKQIKLIFMVLISAWH